MSDPTIPRDPSGTPLLHDRSGTTYPSSGTRWRGDDGTPLALPELAGIGPADIVQEQRSLWRYEGAIPVGRDRRVSLGEGCTPLVAVPWAGAEVHFKLEWFNPTASFKDRGVSVMMSHLCERGVSHVLEDSSGNGGSSVAAYAAAAGVRAKILVPATTSAAKIRQARACGAQVELVVGTRDDVAHEAIRQSEQIPYASHNWHPYFLQGIKTLAYELWESLGFTAPDNVVLVAGAGSIVLGCDLGFGELLRAGHIDRLPRLLVGQPEHWATIVDALDGADPARREPRAVTIAEGAAIANPVRLPEVVEAIRRSSGAAVAVPEPAIVSAVRGLARRGLYAEPTSAVAVAALDHFLADRTVEPGQTTVVVLTGSGLKSAEAMARVFPDEVADPRSSP